MAYPYRHPSEVQLLSKHFGEPEARTLQGWVERGGYQALRKALGMSPADIVTEVKNSGLRGRGGAGFPTGMKWSFMPKKEPGKPHFLVCNADESEPGTFKDRELMRWTPHALIEGCLIGAHAIHAEHAYIYIRGEFFEAAQIMARAIEEAYAAGYIGRNIFGSGIDLDLTLHIGAGAYICGEETGLLNSLEGRRGEPRVKPPFPAIAGAFRYPTAVNNVESLIAAAQVVLNGAEWYKQYGTEKSVGTKLFCVSGHVKRPGNYEMPLGFNFKEFIYDVCGGTPTGKPVKAVIPGGSSVPILKADELDIGMDYESMAAAGTMLGCGSVIVMDEGVNVVKQVRRMVDFYAHESCGQCTPCREGTAWSSKILRRIEMGRGAPEDLDTLLQISDNMSGKTICVLSDAAAAPIVSSIQKFRDDYLALMQAGQLAGAGVR
ncbi:NADH-quinone oxidoreductase subunit NuoF [Longimicrobium terrae]|uniref:NADH-quinone oxidoreductase subunit F n=1 Tax=Longimicrobium terrae TaxID=1639882 RepID=A0A841H021_9BACT|nr:NADH-quinone oxidoreductase subunit NuoF [Longimicrobium terrae]MBB4637040.1 NADH-quinone oxidoreductase subunit F [Longimicrobium terrae]MBB6071352.1 NADH-quinone oxidoreductase subunit F [Longimicrobium terrae]NNC31429.1 NADH-quinone oxidoreductase subunit NuoF [Longimicrobium terrae]